MARKRWIFAGHAAGFAACVAALPLGWVAPLFVPDEVPELTYHGTVWNGTLTDIPVFDTANFDLHPLSLSADIEAGDGTNYVSATVNRHQARDARVVVDLSTLPLTDQRLQGLVGSVAANLILLGYGPEGCTEAEGTVRTDVLQRNGGNMNWTGPELSGPITCETGDLVAILKGEDSEQSIDALLRFSADSTYRVDITARTSRAEAGTILPLFGFSSTGRDFKLTEQGKWR
ncbi:type II secretion system protein N [Litorimonas sp. WD9-15]|uniref:type II secretion system protein N n=1 Tax=Litorimonas sp. WD9-15 TaxID=3418716 RepID=UPI003D026717